MTDRSDSPNVVEYAVQELFKGKSPAAAAKHTAKKLSGFENFFLGPGVTNVDAGKLEQALYDRMADEVIKALKKYPNVEEGGWIKGTLQRFNQIKLGHALPDTPAFRKIYAQTRQAVIEKMKQDSFFTAPFTP